MGACGRGWRAAGYSYPTPALTRRFPSRSQAYVSLSVGGATAAGVGEGVAVAVGVGVRVAVGEGVASARWPVNVRRAGSAPLLAHRAVWIIPLPRDH